MIRANGACNLFSFFLLSLCGDAQPTDRLKLALLVPMFPFTILPTHSVGHGSMQALIGGQ